MTDKTNRYKGDIKQNDDFCRSFPITIDYQGQWYHEGRPVKRQELVKLFSSVLKRDDNGDYWLETPVERGKISVEDVPFIITQTEITYTGPKGYYKVELITNLNEKVKLDKNHVIQMRDNVPYVRVRDNLEARIRRSVFYELAELVDETIKQNNKMGFYSYGTFQPLE